MSVLLPFTIFLYEYFVWQLDIGNFTTHAHHVHLFGRNLFFLFVQMNTWPHLLGAYAFHHKSKWLMVLYLPYLILFTVGQIFTWWLPYFFEYGLWHSDPTGEKLAQFHKYHSNHHRILPKFRNHPVVPDTEHTILFVLTLLTLVTSLRAVILRFRTVISASKKKH